MKASFKQVGGKRILMLGGGIEGNSGDVVGPSIRNKRAYQEVWLCSGGGAVSGGLAIGRALNRAKATVRIPNHFFCASACTIAFMGGYARIIDSKAEFVTHASSGAQSFGAEITSAGIKFKPFAYYRCDKAWAAGFCQQLRNLFEANDYYKKYACKNDSDLYKAKAECRFLDTTRSRYSGNVIAADSRLTKTLSSVQSLTKGAIAMEMRSSLEGELELLHYFQTMLLDGQIHHTNRNSYQLLKRQLVPVNIYDLPETELYYRSIKKDLDSLQQVGGDYSQIFAIWQTMLTDSELSLKTQITAYIRQNNIDLGLAGADAIKMYDAMRTCQIQSSCQLEPHTARSLGYHNMYGHE